MKLKIKLTKISIRSLKLLKIKLCIVYYEFFRKPLNAGLLTVLFLKQNF